MTVFENADVDLCTETVAFNSTRTVGVMCPNYLNSQTRYVRIKTEYLKEWAELVHRLSDGPEVIVGLTPENPLIAKRDEDSQMCVAVAPRVKAGGDSE